MGLFACLLRCLPHAPVRVPAASSCCFSLSLFALSCSFVWLCLALRAVLLLVALVFFGGLPCRLSPTPAGLTFFARDRRLAGLVAPLFWQVCVWAFGPVAFHVPLSLGWESFRHICAVRALSIFSLFCVVHHPCYHRSYLLYYFIFILCCCQCFEFIIFAQNFLNI